MLKPTQAWELMLQAMNPCPSSDPAMSVQHLFSSVYICNIINNQDDGTQKFQTIKTGAAKAGQSTEKEDKVDCHNLEPMSKSNGSVYSQQGKNILTGCTGLKLQAGGTV